MLAAYNVRCTSPGFELPWTVLCFRVTFETLHPELSHCLGSRRPRTPLCNKKELSLQRKRRRLDFKQVKKKLQSAFQTICVLECMSSLGGRWVGAYPVEIQTHNHSTPMANLVFRENLECGRKPMQERGHVNYKQEGQSPDFLVTIPSSCSAPSSETIS